MIELGYIFIERNQAMKYPLQESSSVEFKREIPKNDQIIKTVIGFCNQNGGKLIIGVDNDGTICGVAEEEINRVLEYLDKSIYEAIIPPIIAQVYAQRIGGKTVLIIEVSSGANKPYYVKSEGLEKGTYIRLGRSTMHANADTIEELKWRSRGLSYDMMAVYHATLKDLDLDKFNEFIALRKSERKGKKNINDLLLLYHLIIHEHAHTYPTVAGILLFGKNPQHFFSEAFIICSHFSGIEGRNAIASRDCTGTLLEQFQDAYDFVLSRLNISFTIKGARRSEQREIPEVALREMLINALVHRNYHINASIKIAIYENRIEIFSPGSFPGLLDVHNLKMGITSIRNKAITKIFREAGYMEKLGTGFITLFESYEKYGLPTPEVIEGANYIKCILPRPSARVPILKDQEQDESQSIVNLFTVTTQLSIKEIAENLHMSRATIGRRLAELVKKGILGRRGQGKATRYVLKK
jgi:ATP-dependent DNA helicase RecG